MYIYDQARTSSVSQGIGRLGAFGQFGMKTSQSQEHLEIL